MGNALLNEMRKQYVAKRNELAKLRANFRMRTYDRQLYLRNTMSELEEYGKAINAGKITDTQVAAVWNDHLQFGQGTDIINAFHFAL